MHYGYKSDNPGQTTLIGHGLEKNLQIDDNSDRRSHHVLKFLSTMIQSFFESTVSKLRTAIQINLKRFDKLNEISFHIHVDPLGKYYIEIPY